MEVYTNHQNIEVCSNLVLGRTIFNYFDYFIHRMIIDTPVKEWHNNLYILKQIQSLFLWVISTVGVLGIGGRQPACEVLGHITFSSLQLKNTLPPIKIESVSNLVPSLGTYWSREVGRGSGNPVTPVRRIWDLIYAISSEEHHYLWYIKNKESMRLAHFLLVLHNTNIF